MASYIYRNLYDVSMPTLSSEQIINYVENVSKENPFRW